MQLFMQLWLPRSGTEKAGATCHVTGNAGPTVS
jgi:hypothetical protein